MGPWPIILVELRRTSRRVRHFVARTLYGGLLLFVLYENVQAHAWEALWSGRGVSAGEIARVSRNLLLVFAQVQLSAVVLVTPALLAGVIAEERNWKTLPDLLNTPMSGPAILLGKLTAGLMALGWYLLVGVPYLSLLTLLGGVDLAAVCGVSLIAAATALTLAAVTLLVSTVSRNVREAILRSYGAVFVGLAAPLVLREVMTPSWPPALAGPVSAMIQANPFVLNFDLIHGQAAVGGGLWSVVPMFCGSLLFVAFTVLTLGLLLRPICRRDFSPRKRASASVLARWRHRRRPAPGDEPMLWKELRVARRLGLFGRLAWLAVLAGLGAVVCLAAGWAWLAFGEVRAYGYGVLGVNEYRERFNIFLRIASALLYAATATGVVADAAGSIAGEREADTWTSLTSTPLDGREIVDAKMLGAIRRVWPLPATLLVLWGLGLVSGALHPIGVVLSLGFVAMFLAYAAMLGVTISLRTRSTARAMIAGVAILFATNVGYLMCCVGGGGRTPVILFGCTPLIVGAAGLSYENLDGRRSMGPETPEFVLACLLGFAAHAVAFGALRVSATSGFDEAIGRPRRDAWTGVGPRAGSLGGRSPSAGESASSPGITWIQESAD